MSGVPEDGRDYLITLYRDGEQITEPATASVSVSTGSPDVDGRPFQICAWAEVPAEWSDPINDSPLRHYGSYSWELEIDGVGRIPVQPASPIVNGEVQFTSVVSR